MIPALASSLLLSLTLLACGDKDGDTGASGDGGLTDGGSGDGGSGDGGATDGGSGDGGSDGGSGDGGSGDGGSGDGGSGDGGSTETACPDSAFADAAICTSWLINTTDEDAAVIADGSADARVNVLSVTIVEEGGATYARVQSNNLPDYTWTFTSDDIDWLESRPNARSDFRRDGVLVSAGDTVQFGADIGYDSTGCTGDEGYGFWPPGPECPEPQDIDVLIPTEVEAATEQCWTPDGTMGVLVNGVAIYNWTDTESYESEGSWYNLAQKLEIWDVDMCGGHAGFGAEYHQHFDPTCLSERIADIGDEHSPLYGYGADGVPMYGPWVADGVRAESCWVTRDFDDASDPLGCGGDGQRTCVMVDPLDPSLGTVPADSNGPTTSDYVDSLSGNSFLAESGLYFEDYYYDPGCTDGSLQKLDEHNGHDHDGLGYHTHVTDTFPYMFGPTYYGRLHDNALTECLDQPVADMGGGGGGGM